MIDFILMHSSPYRRARIHVLGMFFFIYHCFVLPNANAVSAGNFFNLPVATKYRNTDSRSSGVTALLQLVSW